MYVSSRSSFFHLIVYTALCYLKRLLSATAYVAEYWQGPSLVKMRVHARILDVMEFYVKISNEAHVHTSVPKYIETPSP